MGIVDMDKSSISELTDPRGTACPTIPEISGRVNKTTPLTRRSYGIIEEKKKKSKTILMKLKLIQTVKN